MVYLLFDMIFSLVVSNDDSSNGETDYGEDLDVDRPDFEEDFEERSSKLDLEE